MTRIHALLIGGLILALVVGFSPQRRDKAGAEDELTLKVRRFIAAFERNNSQGAAEDLDETMLKVLGPGKLAELWKQLPGQLGTFKKQTAHGFVVPYAVDDIDAFVKKYGRR